MLEGCNIGLRPNGEQVSGATPNMKEQFPSGCRAPGLIQSRQQARLDLETLRNWYRTGQLKGGIYLPDPQYLLRDYLFSPVTGTGQEVGVWFDATNDTKFGPDLLAGKLESSSGWTLYSGVSISNGTMTVGSVPASTQVASIASVPLDTNKAYVLSYLVTEFSGAGGNISSGILSSWNGNLPTVGVPMVEILPLGPKTKFGMISRGTGITSATIKGFSLREILGNHAYQATFANKPLFQKTSQSLRPWLSGDSTDSLPIVFPSALSTTYTAAMGRRNLLFQTGELSNAIWLNPSNNQPSVTSEIGPTGDKAYLVDAGSGWGDLVQFVSPSIPVGTVVSGSIYVKSATGSPLTCSMWLDSTASAGSNIVIGTGWTRISASTTTGSGASLSIRNATGNFYACSGQYEYGSVTTPYEKITHGNTPVTVARATPTGVSYSEDENFSSATWNSLCSPYQYNSAVIVAAPANPAANWRLSAYQKAVIERVLKRYVPVLSNKLVMDTEYYAIAGGQSTWSSVSGNKITYLAQYGYRVPRLTAPADYANRLYYSALILNRESGNATLSSTCGTLAGPLLVGNFVLTSAGVDYNFQLTLSGSQLYYSGALIFPGPQDRNASGFGTITALMSNYEIL